MRIGPAFLFGLSSLLPSLPGCGAEDVVTAAPTCNDVCNRYQECFDEDYDVTGCTQDCADAAIDDEAFQDQIDSCDDCLDRTCVGVAFACATECAGIVP